MDGMSGCRWVIPQHMVHASAPEENPKQHFMQGPGQLWDEHSDACLLFSHLCRTNINVCNGTPRSCWLPGGAWKTDRIQSVEGLCCLTDVGCSKRWLDCSSSQA